MEHDSKESEMWLRTLEKIGRPQDNWESVGDRANDIQYFGDNANSLKWKYVVRAQHDRKVELAVKKTAKYTSKLNLKAKGEEFGGGVTLAITWIKAKLISPGNTGVVAKEAVTYIQVGCNEKPKLEWLLITNLPVDNKEDVLKIVGIYRKRWLIEDYHKVVKTGFLIEDNQLKQAKRIFALFGMIAILATQLLAMR